MTTPQELDDMLDLIGLMAKYSRGNNSEYDQGYYAGLRVAQDLIINVDRIKLLLGVDHDN